MVRVGMTLDRFTLSRLARIALQKSSAASRFVSKSEVVRELIANYGRFE